MKGRAFPARLGFAWRGIVSTLRREASFRTHLFAAGGVIVVAWLLHPPALWLALLIVMVVLVLAAELVNTAIEEILDGLHPEVAEFARRAKDAAAAAVLLLSFGALAVLVLMCMDMWRSAT